MKTNKLLLVAFILIGFLSASNTHSASLEELTIEIKKNPDYYWGGIATFYATIDGQASTVACIHFKNKIKSVYVHSLRVAKAFRNQGLGGEIIQWFKQFVTTNYPKAQSINWIAAPLDPDKGENPVDAYKRLCDYYKRQNATVDNGNCHIPLEKRTLWQRLCSSISTPKSRI